jgi:hypothetical protein
LMRSDRPAPDLTLRLSDARANSALRPSRNLCNVPKIRLRSAFPQWAVARVATVASRTTDVASKTFPRARAAVPSSTQARRRSRQLLDRVRYFFSTNCQGAMCRGLAHDAVERDVSRRMSSCSPGLRTACDGFGVTDRSGKRRYARAAHSRSSYCSWHG